jgi:hypothetical protein
LPELARTDPNGGVRAMDARWTRINMALQARIGRTDSIATTGRQPPRHLTDLELDPELATVGLYQELTRIHDLVVASGPRQAVVGRMHRVVSRRHEAFREAGRQALVDEEPQAGSSRGTRRSCSAAAA